MALIRPPSSASLADAAPYPPHPLAPTGIESFDLPSGRRVAVSKATPTFSKWTGTLVTDTFNGKAVFDAGGRPAFAELAILWSLRDRGWSGVWREPPSVVAPRGPRSCTQVDHSGSNGLCDLLHES